MSRDVLLGRDHLVIAEVAQAHDGDLNVAHKLIDLASRAGAHVVKFQTHIAAEESTAREPWRVKFSDKDATRYDYWKRMEFSRDEWRELKMHCDSVGVEFMSSPFSPKAIELLLQVGVRLWKVASGEVANTQILDHLGATGLPIIFSSGLSTIQNLQDAVTRVNLPRNQIAILQCATQYPTPPKLVGLNVISELIQNFGCIVGISDHTSTIYSSIAAAALGARIFEVHVRLDDDSVGPDSSSSLTENQLSELVQGVDFVRGSMLNPVDKHSLSEDQVRLATIFGRSLVASRDLINGSVIGEVDVAFKKPGGGMRYEQLGEILGKVLRINIEQDHQLSLADIEVDT